MAALCHRTWRHASRSSTRTPWSHIRTLTVTSRSTSQSRHGHMAAWQRRSASTVSMVQREVPLLSARDLWLSGSTEASRVVVLTSRVRGLRRRSRWEHHEHLQHHANDHRQHRDMLSTWLRSTPRRAHPLLLFANASADFDAVWTSEISFELRLRHRPAARAASSFCHIHGHVLLPLPGGWYL